MDEISNWITMDRGRALPLTLRVCPACKGSGDEDQWDEAAGPCLTCFGEGEI